MSDDSFVREVDEAVRQDEFKRLWDKYGLYIMAGAVLIVATVAGYKGWGYWQAKQAAEVIAAEQARPTAYDAAEAKKLFEAKCSQCHQTDVPDWDEHVERRSELTLDGGEGVQRRFGHPCVDVEIEALEFLLQRHEGAL